MNSLVYFGKHENQIIFIHLFLFDHYQEIAEYLEKKRLQKFWKKTLLLPIPTKTAFRLSLHSFSFQIVFAFFLFSNIS